jgi:hypothetical protein
MTREDTTAGEIEYGRTLEKSRRLFVPGYGYRDLVTVARRA